MALQSKENDFIIFQIIYNNCSMKHFHKLALLTSIFALSLASCSNKTRLECFETSDTADPVSGMCYQIGRKDVIENFYVLANPINPDADPKDYQYDFTWRDDMRVEHISFVEGLEGKRVISFLKLNSHSLKLQIDSTLSNPKATSGYVKISHLAFDALSERAKTANLYAYVAIGDDHGLVEKPSQNQTNE